MIKKAAIVVALVLTAFLSTNPAYGASYVTDSPTLENLNIPSSRWIDKGACTFIPYRVRDAGYFKLEYRGPDNVLRYAEADGHGPWFRGEIGVCTESDWPSGYYWLRSVQLECPLDSAEEAVFVSRWFETVKDCNGVTTPTSVQLGRSDFNIR